uniref:Uncharacterized protein n=1 Tax=viral metagenome TaxID=1070528 RepID=A0A6C0I1E9_9ZZZZ
MESSLEILLRNNGILCHIMQYIGSIKYCIFTFSLLFRELDGYINITEVIKEIFIHHIYTKLYTNFFRPIQNNQDHINKLYKIFSNAKKEINFTELALICAEHTVSYLTTPDSDNYWFIKIIEEYYYIGGINIIEWRLIIIKFDNNEDYSKINWGPIHNLLLAHLDNKVYRFHIDKMTRYYIDEDTTLLDDFYSNELRKLLNIGDNGNGNIGDNGNNYEYDKKILFWAVMGLVFTICTDYSDRPKKRDLLMKQCTIILYTNYFNNTMLLTYSIFVADIFSNCTFIKTQFGSIFEFLAYFNNAYPYMAVDLDADRFCSILDLTR